MLKVSLFNVVCPLAEFGLPDYDLIFNTFSSRKFIIKDEKWRQICTILNSPHEISEVDIQAVHSLRKANVLVPQDEDELKKFRINFDTVRYHPRQIFPIITVTTKCNLGCIYCYEEGVISSTMSADVVEGMLRWMEKRILQDSIREITPALFGGEPLLYPSTIFAIMDGFKALQQRYGVRGNFFASSNGVLLTRNLARELAERGLTRIQISLDGPKMIHDFRRKGKKGQGTYQESLLGIKNAVDHIRNVTVKINIDRHNRSTIGELFKVLVDEGLQGRVDVKLEAVACQLPGSLMQYNSNYIIPPESIEMADSYSELMWEARKQGIKVTEDTAHTTPCMFTSHHGVIFGPDGSIYKCVSLVGRPKFRVGSVLDSEYESTEYERQMDVETRLVQCYQERCPLIPICAAGCAYESIVRTGRYDVRFCTRERLMAFHRNRYLLNHQKDLEAFGFYGFPFT